MGQARAIDRREAVRQLDAYFVSAAEQNRARTSAAGTSPDRNPKWQRGWASGYLDAYREVIKHRR